ncbi:hypothetical protein DPEC_G00036500 [Dallia pectoralis]|uniref:Uncharacterized protein n=1 Tax=Dallia pectoralis TaxID=75939 RepID=A0ACC2HEC3_DALPE|nr:hypothetical protein DPEC_G00036500 [Dallia pectoralis]
MSQAKNLIIMSTQRAAFPVEFGVLTDNRDIPKSSPLIKLNPIIDENIIRIGGRLRHAELEIGERNPIILPRQSHITELLVRHYHNQVKHQGRHFTEGAIRSAGLWIISGKRLISSILHGCVTCRKLRGKMEIQRMADLPSKRLCTAPPFTFVGLDVFGPWNVTARRTRGGHAQSKRWAVMFTCMSTRAVHIEVIETMDTSSCINA